MSDGSGKVAIAREGSRDVSWIAVPRCTAISFVANQCSDEKFGFRVKRNSVVEVDRLCDTGAMELEIVNYLVAVALTGNVPNRCNLYNCVGNSTGTYPGV